MSDLVLDASAAVDATLASDGFRMYSEHTLHAPDLLWWEVNSVIREHVWRGDVPAAAAEEAMQRLHAQQIHQLLPTADLLRAATSAAERLGWAKVYDAVYLAVALAIPGSRLVTRDARLQRGALRLVEIIAPADI